MRIRARQIFWMTAAWAATVAGASAQDTGATKSGDWNKSTIWTGGSVPGSSNNVYIGSTYPSGAALTATVTLTQGQSANNVYLGYGSGADGTLKLEGQALTITNSLVIGYGGGTGVVKQDGGSFSAASAYVEHGNSLTFGTNDVVSYLQLSGGSSATTAASGNVSNGADVLSGSELILKADTTLSGNLNVQDSGSVLDMKSNSLSATSLYLGWNGASAVSVDNRGALTLSNLYVGNGMTFNVTGSDSVTTANFGGGSNTTLHSDVVNLNLTGGSTGTSTDAGAITGSASVESGSTLNLGVHTVLTGDLNVQDSGSTLNAQGHNLTADALYVGWNGTSEVSVVNVGKLTLNDLYVGNSSAGSDLTLHGGDLIHSLIDLQNGSVLTVQQVNGTGLTLDGTSLSSLTLDSSSLDLIFNLNDSSNWDFRWKDQGSVGYPNWVSTIDAMIAAGEIVISSQNGYSVIDRGGYTYIMGGVSSVPEPSSLMLACVAIAGVTAAALRCKGQQSGR